MVRIIKQFFWLVVLVAAMSEARAFSPIGPPEAYQTPDIGYNPNINIGDGLASAPMNIGEEYRRNTPLLYYGFDQSFLDYFGADGVAAVDAAFQVFNGLAQTNLTSYSADLSEFPTEASRVNFQAQALGLTDVKSTIMTMLTEQLGLTHPDRYTWTLHSRQLIGQGPCPANMNYLVIKRNFDPVFTSLSQLQSSSYVNGTLYTYTIVEYCTAANSPVPPMLADATEYPVDPLATVFTAVAAGFTAPILYGGTAFSLLSGQLNGAFYTGLTRDDVGGLRYLMRTNNLNIESAGTDAETFITNTTPQLLFTSNLTELVTAALTNDPATLTALFPNLQIGSSTSYFTNVVTATTVFYFTNFPFEPAITPATLVSSTVLTTNILTYWNHQFLNVYITPNYQLVSNLQVPFVPGHSTSNGLITIWTTNVSTACGPYLPPGTACTNISASSTMASGSFGDYYILPAGLCSVSIVSTQLTIPITVTAATIVATTPPGTTNVGVQSFSQTTTYNFYQYIYVVRPVVCPVNLVSLRQGIETIRFERRDYDSLLNQFFYPATNTYVLNAISNNTITPQPSRRTVATPDILFTAADLTGESGSVTINAYSRNVPFVAANALPGLAGPGTIAGPVTVTLNKVGAVFGNVNPGLGEDTQTPVFIWGSYDGSTNAPIVYPNGTSIQDLENQVLIQVGPSGPALPDAKLGVNYATQFTGFTVNGGTPPYHWTVVNGALPPGLILHSTTGAISGVPTTANIYDFVLRLAESNARFVDRPYSITVNP